MKRLLHPLLGVLLILPLGGCNGIARRVASIAASQNSAPRAVAADVTYLGTLKPADSGIGLLVYEPVVAPALKPQAAWGNGAARWLQVQVGGLPELGATPSWSASEEARVQLKSSATGTAAKLARSYGATHVAVGTLRGTPNDAILRYEVRQITTGKTVGAAQIHGSLADLGARLPALAQTLSSALGAKAAPAAVALSSADLQFLGALPHPNSAQKTLAPAQKTRLQTLANRDALAGLLLQRTVAQPEHDEWQTIADTLLEQAPRNALVWGEVAEIGAIRLMDWQPQLAAMQRKFPGNIALCRAGFELEREKVDAPTERRWAEKVARLMPQDSGAWIDLSGALSDEASLLRKGRSARQMSADEWADLEVIYGRSRAAALRATRVDVDSVGAWLALSRAAIWASDKTASRAALDKAIALDAADEKVWTWGLQLSHPDWGGDADGYVAFAMRAAQNADRFRFPATDLYGSFTHMKRRADFKKILEIVVAKDPKNVEALTELGGLYHYDDAAYPQAEQLYQRALALDPKYANALSSLGDLTYWVHNDPRNAFELYRRAILADPKNPNLGYYHANLGRMLYLTGYKKAGTTEAKLARNSGYSDRVHPVWQLTGVSPD